jgi:hypothetical protein
MIFLSSVLLMNQLHMNPGVIPKFFSNFHFLICGDIRKRLWIRWHIQYSTDSVVSQVRFKLFAALNS